MPIGLKYKINECKNCKNNFEHFIFWVRFFLLVIHLLITSMNELLEEEYIMRMWEPRGGKCGNKWKWVG
jgi:hypothetical protein